MLTMTSLQAQTNFAQLLDTSQREAVIITRRGRPCSAVISDMGNPRQALTQFLMAMSALHPLRGAEAQKAIDKTFSLIDNLGEQAEKDGLTEADVTRLVHEARAA
jgi:antitoxin (DNA-binding transcriptional repressor) of toxin-antitoxin stability system